MAGLVPGIHVCPCACTMPEPSALRPVMRMTKTGITIRETPMNGIIYIVGLIVVIMFVLSLLGLR
jgi:hypothetical protein